MRDLYREVANEMKVPMPNDNVKPFALEPDQILSLHRTDPATRAWNFSVDLYYKAGGVPWRLPPTGPDTCFVGVSFHHFRTTKRAVARRERRLHNSQQASW